MKCSGCGSENFRLDEISGSYVCISCWQVSDVFDGLTQNQELLEAGSHGLRVLENTQVTTQSSAFRLPFALSEPATFRPKDEAKEKYDDTAQQGTQSDSKVPIPSSSSTNLHAKARRIRSKARSWRMTEAFALLLHEQSKEVLRVHILPKSLESPGIADRFRLIIHALWFNYLAITGEFGQHAWAAAFKNVSTAVEVTMSSREDYMRTQNSKHRSCANRLLPRIGRCVDGSEKDTGLLQIIKSKLGQGFPWAGWGGLYHPNESEQANNPFFLFETSFEKENATESDAETNGTETPPNSGLSGSDSEDEFLRRKRPRQLLRNAEHSPPLPTQNIKACSPTSAASDSSNYLATKYQNMLAEHLKSKEHRNEMFWHGQLSENRSNWLLEYNLSIIFLGALLSTTVITEDNIATCRHDFLTLHDLTSLCKDREKFPYLAAERWTSSHFDAYNINMQKVFRRFLPPDLPTLVRITTQSIHMQGITERPRLPLCSMVHRFLRDLQFPPEAHTISNSIMTILSECVKKEIPEDGLGMTYFLPLYRYFRGEVFAMAVVVVAARVLFKLDGDFEHRWDNVANFLTENPQKYALLMDLLRSSKDGGTGGGVQAEAQTIPFVWSLWARKLPCREPEQRKSTSRCCQGDEPLHSAVTSSQLLRMARNTDHFLGPLSSFNPQTDEGWGEKHGTPRPHASKEFKLSLIDSLSQLVHKTNLTTDNLGTSALRQWDVISSNPCTSCAYTSKHFSFSRPLRNTLASYQWTTFDCNALFRAHRFIQSNNFPPVKFLKKIILPGDNVEDVRQDWLYILQNCHAYEPITLLDFSIKCHHHGQSSAEYPPAVKDFLEDHKSRLFRFMSGKPVNKNSSIGVHTPHPMCSKDKPSNSMYWFLESASWTCGARMPQLLREVKCIEELLGFYRNEKQQRYSWLRDIALAYHFDYTVCHDR